MAYINTDVCMSGPILEPVASPTLMDILVPATRDIVSPADESQSYYDYWQQWSGQGDSFNPEVGCMDNSYSYVAPITSLGFIMKIHHCLYLSAKYPIFNQHQLPSRRAQAH